MHAIVHGIGIEGTTMTDRLHWHDRATDQGEAQWAAEALGITYVVTKLATGAYLLAATDRVGGTPDVPALSRPVTCDSEEDAKGLAQSWYEDLIHGA